MNKQELNTQFKELEKSFLTSSIEIRSFISSILQDQIEILERLNALENKIGEN